MKNLMLALLVALGGCLTDDESEIEALTTDTTTTTADSPQTIECPPVPSTLPAHVDGDVTVVEPPSDDAPDWLEALSPSHGEAIRAND